MSPFSKSTMTTSSKRIQRLGLSSQVQEKLQRQNINNAQEMLNKGHLELIQILGLNYNMVHDVLIHACRATAPRPVTALQLKTDQSSEAYLSTSLPSLDRVLHGGLLSSTITEITGPSGCGKTQMCMMLCVIAALPRQLGGLDGAVIYIDTEAAFSARRLLQIAEERFPDQFPSEMSLLNLASQVHVFSESSNDSLLKRLQTLEDEVISKRAKLVILDSVASLVRKQYDSSHCGSLTERANVLAKEAAILKCVAEAFHIPVVVTNQITTQYKANNSSSDKIALAEHERHAAAARMSDGHVTAALGNTWSHCVNTRIILQFSQPPLRQLLVAKSPLAAFCVFDFSIEARGVVLQDDNGGQYEGTDPGLQKICVRSSHPWSNTY